VPDETVTAEGEPFGSPEAPEEESTMPGAPIPPVTPPTGDATPAPGALLPGSLLQERFEILGVVGHEGDETLYQAWDRARCWQCDATSTPPGEAYCVNCGAELAAHRVMCRVRETLVQPGEVEPDAITSLAEYGRWYVVLPGERAPAAGTGVARGGLRLSVGFASHPGQVRERDEDSLVALTFSAMFEGRLAPALGFYAVADGLGGHEEGQVASCLAARLVADGIARRVLLPEVMGETCLEETATALLTLAVKEANAHIYQVRQRRGSEMGSTFTAALVRGDTAIVANVGDSRTYLWRAGKLGQISTDHSAVARLIELGEVRPEDIYTHPQRATIYRSLGDKSRVEVDSFVRRLDPGDRLLLCCDGVWESLHHDGLEEALLAEPDPQRAADEMIRRANLAGGEDNLSAIVVSLER
jgi:serine/threonine protein phosphatase PrpC